jgi:hypothetical protein
MTPERRRASRLLCRAVDLRKRGYDGKALDLIEKALAHEHERGYNEAHEFQMRMRVRDAMERK